MHSIHCSARAFYIAHSRKNRPALGNRINLTFGIDHRPKGGTVVEVCPPVPLAIPTVLVDILSKLRRIVQATFREEAVTAHTRNIRESQEHFVKKESQPDAF